ncbi:MAG: NUDIX domain-containing protein [Anaerolineales bacterium]
MTRAAAIVIKNNAVALIKRQREGRTYYVFPGGSVEEDETPEQAAIREAQEELGLEVSIDRLVARVFYERGGVRRTDQYYFLTRITGGTFGAGTGPEMQGLYPPESGTYKPIWMPIRQLIREVVYPLQVANLVMSSAKLGWPTHPVDIHERI